MKKFYLLFAVVILMTLLCSCGVSQADYTALQNQYDQLQEDYNALQQDYHELEVNSAEWFEYSENERAAKLAQAEADRIAAEEAEKKAEEEQEAARKAEEEAAAQKAEEDARKGYDTGITFNNLARNPDDFRGQKVKFTGEVLQVIESDSEVDIRLSTRKDQYDPSTKPQGYKDFFNGLKAGKKFNKLVYHALPKACFRQNLKGFLIKAHIIGGV